MTDSHAAPAAEARPQSGKSSRMRLIIRAEIIPDKPVATTAPQPSGRSSRALIVGAVAVLALVCGGVVVFRAGAGRIESPLPAPALKQPGPTISDSPTLTASPAAGSVQSQSSPTNAAGPAAPNEPEAPPIPVNEVLPTPSSGALQTIRGTVRVLVRVSIDGHGAVIAAASEDAGPSRYFERLSLESARQWIFTTGKGDGQRTALLRFHFTHAGVTARVDPAG